MVNKEKIITEFEDSHERKFSDYEFEELKNVLSNLNEWIIARSNKMEEYIKNE